MNNDKELFIKAGNSMIHYLSPEELEAYAQAEQAATQAEQAKLAMIEQIKARNVSGWLDPISEEERAVLDHFSPEEQKALRIMTEEERFKFSQLLRRKGEAKIVLSELIDIASQRAER